MATLKSIQARIAKLQAQAAELAARKPTAVLERIRELMEKHGIGVADIEAHVGKRRGRKARNTVANAVTSAAKYRDPKTGATWTGHGRAPAWIADAKDRTKFLVEEAPAKSARAASATAQSGNYVRGPQPPKYRDPKSGATWSGRGRAPAWLAGVKDLSKFLIEIADDAASTAKPTATKKTSATRKAEVKKTATEKNAAIKKAATKSAVQASKKAPAKKVSVKKAAPKKAPAKQVAREAVNSAVADAPVIQNVPTPSEGAETA
ncbi:TPA: H-NS histone family protein [Burkholderia vietnamiensis]|nr:H-NS histone family protein [Burkholderia vietnamiensis]